MEFKAQRTSSRQGVQALSQFLLLGEGVRESSDENAL
jgi:hypothetical protein